MSKQSPTILAIETATSACSAALSFDGITYSKSQVGNNIHSQVLLEMVQQLLEEPNITVQDLDAVAVGQGPGSFTGLRIGVGVAQGIAYGAKCGMVGVSSLDVLAHQAEFDGAVVAGIDARMNEIYWCEYTKSGDRVERLNHLSVDAPIDIVAQQANCQWVGNAWAEYQNDFSSNLKIELPSNERLFPQAESLLVLGQHAFISGKSISPVEFAPEYVRNDVAKKTSKKPF